MLSLFPVFSLAPGVGAAHCGRLQPLNGVHQHERALEPVALDGQRLRGVEKPCLGRHQQRSEKGAQKERCCNSRGCRRKLRFFLILYTRR